ncbi:MAG: hypothetical protein ACRDTH_20880 [Pseudonocardiaceae bacterium]
MSAPAERLHVHAHRAAARVRDINNWWGSPLDTALAAVAAAQHPAASREVAQRAVDRLLRWWQEGRVRPISADAAALGRVCGILGLGCGRSCSCMIVMT